MILKYAICGLLVLCVVEGRPKEIKCPDYCKCDIVEGLRRATCQNKKLYSIEIDMPPQAEILDLSFNQISELGGQIFLEIGLTDLKLLNLSHNKVGHIHLNGFEGLTKLKTLDLSYNVLRYFTDQWFVSLDSLKELYLKGNNLKSINEEPRIHLKRLRVLDISNCAITSLTPGVFRNIPNLEVLDISENYLINFDVEVITSLPKLTTLIVNDNNFDCKDLRMAKLRNYTRDKGISYKDPCPKAKKKKTQMFERMMSLEPQVPDKNGWIYDEEEEQTKNVKVVEVCGDNNKSRNVTFDNAVNDVLLELVAMSPIISIVIIFTFGLVLGLILGCSIEIKSIIQEGSEEFLHLPDGTIGGRTRTMSIGSRLANQEPETRSFIRQNSTGSRATALMRQNSTSSNFRPRSKSTGSRKTVREDRNILLLHSADFPDSTPVSPRKTYV